jgi:hypothetical protein
MYHVIVHWQAEGDFYLGCRTDQLYAKTLEEAKSFSESRWEVEIHWCYLPGRKCHVGQTSKQATFMIKKVETGKWKGLWDEDEKLADIIQS